jgi:hypothetical protein
VPAQDDRMVCYRVSKCIKSDTARDRLRDRANPPQPYSLASAARHAGACTFQPFGGRG